MYCLFCVGCVYIYLLSIHNHTYPLAFKCITNYYIIYKLRIFINLQYIYILLDIGTVIMQLLCIPSLLNVSCVNLLYHIIYIYEYYRYLPIPAHIQMKFVQNVSHQIRIISSPYTRVVVAMMVRSVGSCFV